MCDTLIFKHFDCKKTHNKETKRGKGTHKILSCDILIPQLSFAEIFVPPRLPERLWPQSWPWDWAGSWAVWPGPGLEARQEERPPMRPGRPRL